MAPSIIIASLMTTHSGPYLGDCMVEGHSEGEGGRVWEGAKLKLPPWEAKKRSIEALKWLQVRVCIVSSHDKISQ